MRTRFRSTVRASLLGAIAGVLCTASAGLAETYIVTPLTKGLNGIARDISPTGAVCGRDDGRAFVWRPSAPNAVTGAETILPSLITNFSSDAYGVSSSGLVVGHTGDNPLQQHEVPVVWNLDGSITKLPLFNGVTSGGMATGINDNGLVTGRNGLFTTDATVVLWNTNGTGTPLGGPSGFDYAYGWKLNTGGAIVGTASLRDGTSRAFIHANGMYALVPLLPGATLTSAYDINDAGHVVGTSTFSTATSFFYNGSVVQGLANVPGELIQVSSALGLNAHDQIVGYGNASPNITNALIWDTPGALPRHLASLIDTKSPGYVDASNPGWIITEAVAINDLGQIAARGVSTSGGSYRALLLTPAGLQTNPPPATPALHVQSQNVTRIKSGNKVQAQDVVLVAEGLGSPVGGAVVTARYSGPTQGTVSGSTGTDGRVVLKSTATRKAATPWCFTVTSVSKSGYTYDAAANVMTQQCESGTFNAAASVIEDAWVAPITHSSAEVRYVLSREAETDVRVFDAAGRLVRTLAPLATHAAGAISLHWDGRDQGGQAVRSGIYFVRFSAGASWEVRKVILMR